MAPEEVQPKSGHGGKRRGAGRKRLSRSGKRAPKCVLFSPAALALVDQARRKKQGGKRESFSSALNRLLLGGGDLVEVE